MVGKSRILVVEDKSGEREALARVLRLEGYEVDMAAGVAEANKLLNQDVDLVISDLRLGKQSGLDLLRHWKEYRPAIPFVMVTAFGEVDSAVEAMKLGAEDYLAKPVDPEELLRLVANCLETRLKSVPPAIQSPRLEKGQGFERIVGTSSRMLEVFDQSRRAALADSTILVTGESGTGKELIAEAIHNNSPRREGPFITVNMAAVPENLVESELFGHTKGAFTGATDARDGRFESADGGTIFIDEIGDFALASQAKLLRVLESRCVTPVGSNDDREVDVRVVAATSRNLEKMVANEQFREDLYYRLNVITIQLPPLRERPDDIPLLTQHFLDAMCESTGKHHIKLTPELRDFLQKFEWPGNVRQLRNCLESMVVLAREDELTIDDLPPTVKAGADPISADFDIPTGTTLEELERSAVEQALAENNGNRTHTAQSLGISVRTLQRKLKNWGIDEGE